jgi:hypothetical protein
VERVRTLTRAAGLAAFVLAPAAVGCVTVDRESKALTVAMPTVAMPAIAAAKPAPASQVICFWQRRLTPLPDPTHDGQSVLGLPGQMFLVGHKEAAAELDGDLAVMVYDETPRPAGAAPRTPEMWHFTKDTLRKLVTNDERFGRSYALFLPWPPEWRDVTMVKVVARYQSSGKTDLFAAEHKFALDASPVAGVWTDARTGATVGGGSMATAGFDTRSVPDPQKALQQMWANSVVPAGGFGPTAPPGAPPASAGQFAPTAGGVGPAMAPGYPGNGGVVPAGGVPPTNWGQAIPTPPPASSQPIIIPSRGI